MNKTQEFTFSEREELSRLLSQGRIFENIAGILVKDRTTISREVRRKGMNRSTYRAFKANQDAKCQKSKQNRKRKMYHNHELKQFVLDKIKLHWSPDQIAKELKNIYPDNKSMCISHEAIYTYIYVLPRGSLKRELLLYLRQQKKCRRRKGKNQPRNDEKRGQIAEMLSIEERPKEVEHRTIPGHWEGDLIMGKWKRTALGTIVERTTRNVILVPLKNKDAKSVRRAFAHEMKKLPAQMKLSLTYDQGKEMIEHKLFTKNTKVKVYFAHPGSP